MQGFSAITYPGFEKDEAALCTGPDGDAGDGRGPATTKTRNEFEEPGKSGLTRTNRRNYTAKRAP